MKKIIETIKDAIYEDMFGQYTGATKDAFIVTVANMITDKNDWLQDPGGYFYTGEYYWATQQEEYAIINENIEEAEKIQEEEGGLIFGDKTIADIYTGLGHVAFRIIDNRVQKHKKEIFYLAYLQTEKDLSTVEQEFEKFEKLT